MTNSKRGGYTIPKKHKIFWQKMSAKRFVNILRIASSMFVLAIMFSCNPLSVEPISAYIIDEGTHDSYNYNYFNVKSSKVKPIFLRGSKLSFDFAFTESHKYDYTVKDGADINKLYGITSMKVHENSARLGWRYVGDDRFEVFAYYYIEGVRDWYHIITVDVGDVIYYTIDVSKNRYVYTVDGEEYIVENTKNTLIARSFPYFGGNNVAPHKMVFKIIEL